MYKLYKPIRHTNAIPSVRKTSNNRSPLRRGFLLSAFALALACFALLPTARAVSPPPDGGYLNDNTAEGEDALLSLTSGINNTAIGFETLLSNTTGSNNTANGAAALVSNTTGNSNTANGVSALRNNTTGGSNTANGLNALEFNTTGSSNTANGLNALRNNASGVSNTANGVGSLQSNTTGNNNTGNGRSALLSNTTGGSNTANGTGALQNNTTGGQNTANGANALTLNTSGSVNTANGVQALFSNTTGFSNAANGFNALANNTTGAQNVANGVSALLSNTIGNNNTADGISALANNTTGNSNIALGALAGSALTTGSNNIDIGNVGVAGESNKIRIGTKGTQTAAFIAGISGIAVTGSQVVVNSNGKLGVAASSAGFKDKIKPMDKASEAILALEPVTFRYKHELDPEGIPQFGLVAEQVEKVNPDLVARDEGGKPYTVRYETVNAMLLNEFLKEHRKVEEQAATITELKSADTKQEANIAQQQKEIKALTASLKEQASQIQKVIRLRQVEVGNAAPQLVVSDQ